MNGCTTAAATRGAPCSSHGLRVPTLEVRAHAGPRRRSLAEPPEHLEGVSPSTGATTSTGQSEWTVPTRRHIVVVSRGARSVGGCEGDGHAPVASAAECPGERLVVAGGGPEEQALRAIAGTNVTFAGRVSDTELRWLYARCHALVAASHEDFGLTPLEAAGFRKPTAALRWGGFLDTIEEGTNGAFFDEPTPSSCAARIRALLKSSWMNRRFERSPRGSRRDASLNACARRPSRCDEPSPLRMGGRSPLAELRLSAKGQTPGGVHAFPRMMDRVSPSSATGSRHVKGVQPTERHLGDHALRSRRAAGSGIRGADVSVPCSARSVIGFAELLAGSRLESATPGIGRERIP
jgi:hypothetical protein